MAIVTHYDTLKVTQDAPLEVITAAYKALALKYHPDKNPGNADAVLLMQAINVAYKILSEPQKRAEHDAWVRRQERRCSTTFSGKERRMRKAAFQGQDRRRHTLTDGERALQAKAEKAVAEAAAWTAWAEKAAAEAKEAQVRAEEAALKVATASTEQEKTAWTAWAKKSALEAKEAQARADKANAQAAEASAKAIEEAARAKATTY